MKLISENGAQYTPDEFKQFADFYGFKHTTLSPMDPKSNGFSERMVQPIKHLFTKVKESGSDPHVALLCLWTSRIDHHTPIPCEL